MTITVEGICQNGQLKLNEPLALPEGTPVRVAVTPLQREEVRAWLQEVQQLQERIVRQRGFFPDSTPDIAADRKRDE